VKNGELLYFRGWYVSGKSQTRTEEHLFGGGCEEAAHDRATDGGEKVLESIVLGKQKYLSYAISFEIAEDTLYFR